MKKFCVYITDSCTACAHFLYLIKRYVEDGEVEIELVDLEKKQGKYFLKEEEFDIPGVPAIFVKDRWIVGDGIFDYITGEPEAVESAEAL